jgi:hypothetical protein
VLKRTLDIVSRVLRMGMRYEADESSLRVELISINPPISNSTTSHLNDLYYIDDRTNHLVNLAILRSIR